VPWNILYLGYFSYGIFLHFLLNKSHNITTFHGQMKEQTKGMSDGNIQKTITCIQTKVKPRLDYDPDTFDGNI